MKIVVFVHKMYLLNPFEWKRDLSTLMSIKIMVGMMACQFTGLIAKLTQICPKFWKTLKNLNTVLKTTSKKELWVSENGPKVTAVWII